MRKRKKKIEPICGNCRLYDHPTGSCRVAVIIEGQILHMPVFPKDHCHMDELGIEVQEIRWWAEDPKTGKKGEEGKIKMEFPENLKLWEGWFSDSPDTIWRDEK